MPRFGEGDRFHPVDGIHIGRTRVAIRFDPLLRVAGACIVSGKRQDVRSAKLLDQATKVRFTHCHVEGRITGELGG